MKVVILAGGLGTRISEESVLRPKPMIEIGGRPIIWHLMKIFSYYNYNEFVICCGYKGYLIKEYFANYFIHQSDITVDLRENSISFHSRKVEPWKITLVDTGEDTETGGRLLKVRPYIDDEFIMTYGDGLGTVNIPELVSFHRSHGCLATMTAVQPPGRFGALLTDGSKVTSFLEKPKGDGGWINGGFFVLNSEVLSRIHSDDMIWEREPLESLALDGELHAHFHQGFWQPMDTVRDKKLLEQYWQSGSAPWQLWEI